MSSLKLISVRHGAVLKSMVFYTGMQPTELRRLLIATFSPPSSSGRLWADSTMALLDPVTGQTIALHEACADASALPDAVELLVVGNSAELLSMDSAAASASSASSFGPSPAPSGRPLLHHHVHRMQPYPQAHNRQPSHSSQQQQLAHLQQQQREEQQRQRSFSPAPTSPGSPTSPVLPAFPPPFVLTLQSASDVLQALQLSERVIVLLFIHLPSSSSSPVYALYHQLASSSHYPHLLFLSIEHSLLAATAPSVPSLSLPAPPSLQLYYAGTPIGHVLNVNCEQMITLVQSSQELIAQLQAATSASPDPGQSRRVRWEEGEQDEGVLLSTDEAVALEELVLKESPAVQAAYQAFPSLSLVVDAFMRIARHIGNEKERRRGSAAAAGRSPYDELLVTSLQGMKHGGLISADDERTVRRMYDEGGGRVLEVLEQYTREGSEQRLMEGLWSIAMQGKLMAEEAPREWEGRDDSEGMRARRAAARGRRSKWNAPSNRVDQRRPEAADQDDDDEDEEEEDADDDDDEDLDEDEDDEEEDDDGDDEEEHDDDDDDASAHPPYHDSHAPPPPSTLSTGSFSPSSPLYASSISTLATLSAQGEISPSELSFYIHLLTSSHPLMLAAFTSYHATLDMADLVDTLRRIRQKATAPRAAPAPAPASSVDLAALLSLLPAEFISSHGEAISSLIAHKDAILLSALQIWKEQDGAGGHGRGQADPADLQQLLGIVMKRVEKEKRELDKSAVRAAKAPAQPLGAVNETVAEDEAERSAPSASASSALAAAPAAAGDLRPRSPQSPQVSLEQINAVKRAYHSGITQSSNAQQSLSTVLSSLLSSGVITEDEKRWTEARWRDGDARMVAVLHVFDEDGDEDELRDSVTRIAKQAGGARPRKGSDEGKEAAEGEKRDLGEGVEHGQEQQQQQHHPAVTVEDVTATPAADTPHGDVESAAS